MKNRCHWFLSRNCKFPRLSAFEMHRTCFNCLAAPERWRGYDMDRETLRRYIADARCNKPYRHPIV